MPLEPLRREDRNSHSPARTLASARPQAATKLTGGFRMQTGVDEPVSLASRTVGLRSALLCHAGQRLTHIEQWQARLSTKLIALANG